MKKLVIPFVLAATLLTACVCASGGVARVTNSPANSLTAGRPIVEWVGTDGKAHHGVVFETN